MSSPRSSTYLVLGTVVLMIGLQIVAKYLPGGDSLKREKPGPARGDLVLVEDDLPKEIAGWTRTKFIPAPPVDELPEGQFWWVQQWQYQKDRTISLVSFDQLGESNWHELTYCYTGLGWSIASRECVFDSTRLCPYVVAQMVRDSGEHGVLVFSIFFQDANWASPPGVDLDRLNWRQFKESGVLAEAKNRLGLNPVPPFVDSDFGSNRTLQCQVFVATREEISQELRSAVIQLHLAASSELREHWLGAASPSKLPQLPRKD